MTRLSYTSIASLALALVFGLFLLSSTATAQPSPTINYQGKLTTPAGVAVPDGEYNMRFWLLTSEGVATTSAEWTESLTGSDQVQVTNGLFSVMLGSTSPLTSVDFNQTLYLGVEIGGTGSPAWDGELSPRKILGTVPAAFEASRVGGVASSSFLRSDVDDTASGLLNFTSGFISSASSSINNLNFGTATGTNLVINGESFSDFTGLGLVNDAGSLSVSTTSLNLVTSLQDLSDVAAITETLGDLLYWNGNEWADLATSSLNVALGDTTGTLGVTRGGTGLTSVATGDLIYGSGANTISALTAGADGQILQLSGGLPSWAATSSLGITSSPWTISGSDISYTSGSVTGSTFMTSGGLALGAGMTREGVWNNSIASLSGLYGMTSDQTNIREIVPETIFASAYSIDVVSTPLQNGNVFISYRDVDNSNRGTFVIYDPAGNEVVGPTVFESGTTQFIDTTTLQNGNVFISYQDNGNSQYGTFVIYDPAGNEVVAPTVFESADTREISATPLPNGNVLVSYQDGGNSFYGTFVIYDSSGNQVAGSTVFESAAVGDISAVTLQDGNIFIGYRDQGNSNYGTFVIYDAAGNEVVAPTVFESAIIDHTSVTTLQNGNVLISYADDGNSSYGTFVIYDPAGNEVVAPTVFENSEVYDSPSVALPNGNVLISYNDVGNGDYPTFVIYDQAGNEVVGPTVFKSDRSYNISATLLKNGNVFIGYRDWGNGSYGTFVIYGGSGTTFTDRLAVDTNTEVGYDLFNITGSTTATTTAITQLGSGDVFTLNNSVGRILTVNNAGNVGIGTSSPSSKLTVAGNTWLDSNIINLASSSASSLVLNYNTAATSTILNNSAYAFTIATSTDVAPVFRIDTSGSSANTSIAGGFDVNNGAIYYNASNNLTSIQNLQLGNLNFADDSGVVSWVDMGVTGASSVGTPMSYSAAIDGNDLLTLYALADGSGGITDSAVGIGTSSPFARLTIDGDLALSRHIYDSTYATGTAGYILQTTNTGTEWVATSSLGIGGGITSVSSSTLAAGNWQNGYLLQASTTATSGYEWVATSSLGIGGGGGVTAFTGLTDTQGSLTANRLIFTNGAGDSLTDSSNLTFDGTDFGLGASNGIAFGGTRYLYASSTNDSVSFGENAGATFNSGTTYNVAIGYEAGRYASTSGSIYNNFIGWRAGLNNTGDGNNIFGQEAGLNNSSYSNNIFGNYAGYGNTGSLNNLFGSGAGRYNSGDRNNIFGSDAGENNTGSYNNIFGGTAGIKNIGDYNEIFGYQAGYNLQATSSIVIGSEALRGGSGSTAFQAINNTAIGYRAGYNAQTGSDGNILLGYRAADNLTTGANNIVIGYDVDLQDATADNTLNIGNLIFGTGVNGTGTTLSSGNIGIGTSSPSAKLTVAGTATIEDGVVVGSSDLGLLGSNESLRVIGSFAGGDSSVSASGTRSFAYGAPNTVAEGDAAVALGHGATASGDGSFAVGYMTSATLQATNLGSVAMGRAGLGTLESSGVGSIALGAALSGDLRATGQGSVAIGENVEATANNAFAFGRGFENGVSDSFSLGFGSNQFLLEGSSGNIGIGTTSPLAKLTIDGDLALSRHIYDSTYATGTAGSILQTTDTGVEWAATSSLGFSTVASLEDLTDVSSMTEDFGDLLYWNGSSWADIATSSLGLGDGSFLGLSDTPGSYTSNAIPYVSGSSLNFDSNFTYDGSNLGIGTASPGAMLDIFGVSNSLRLSYDGSTYNEFFTNSAGELVINSTGGTDSSIVLGSGSAEDLLFGFDGSATDYYFGVDDSTDEFTFGTGLTMGANAVLSITDATTTINNAFVSSSTATSTFANGIELEGGCFRDASGSCIKTAGDTVVTVAANDTPANEKAYADYVADGTNDEVTIQAAIDYAYNGGQGGTVHLLSGQFNIASSSIQLATSSRLIGQGSSTVLYLVDNADVPTNAGMVEANFAHYTYVAHLNLQGNKVNNSAGSNRGIEFNNTDTSTIEQVTANDFDYYGFGLNSSTNNILTSNTANNNSFEGFSLNGSGNNTLTFNTANNNPNGFILIGSANNTLTSNTANNNSYGFNISFSDYNIFTSNTANNNSYGFNISFDYNNTVTSNHVEENVINGIAVTGSFGTLEGNYLNNNGGGSNSSISVGGDNNSIIDNTIYATGTAALISVSGSGDENTTIAGNILTNFDISEASYIDDNGTNTRYDQYNRRTLATNGTVGYDLLNITGSTTATATAITQLGTGDIFTLNNSVGRVLTVNNDGYFGIGTSSPNAKLTVAGDINIDNSDTSAIIRYLGNPLITASTTNDSYAFGENAGLTFNSDTTGNVAIGFEAGQYASTSTSDYNNFIGYQAGQNNTGNNNNLFGQSAGINNTGSYNNLFGQTAGRFNTGSDNNFFGRIAGRNNTGDYNNVLGYAAGRNNSGDYNNIFGWGAGFGNGGSNNNIFGYSAGYFNNGDYNEMFGYEAGRNLQATSSIVIGGEALRGGSGSTPFQAINNTAIGYRAGYNAQTGSDGNVLLGYRAADNLTTGANNIVIGYDIDLQDATDSNTLNIGNLIFGTGINGTGTTMSSGNIGIGSSSPSARLTIQGDGGSSNDLFTVASSSLTASSSEGYAGGQYFNINENGRTTITGSAINPMGVGSIADGANGADRLSGSSDIAIAGNYAYVPSSIDDGMQILDISDPTNPTGVGSITDGTNGADSLDGATAIAVSGNHAYVSANVDNGIQIIDISDPTNPTGVGSITDGTNGADTLGGAQGITVEGNYAYVTGASDHGIQIIDISDPTNPTGVGSITDGTNGADTLGGAQDITVEGNYAYVTGASDNGIQIIDISDPTNPTGVGSITDGTNGADTLGGTRRISVSGKYAYVTAGVDDGMQILDISDPTNPTGVGSITDGTNGAEELYGALGVTVSGKYAYVAAQNDSGVQVIDISSSTNPVGVGSITDGSAGSDELFGARGIIVSGNYVYVASYLDHGVQVLDIGALDVANMYAGNIRTDQLRVDQTAEFDNGINARGGLNVGQNALIDGALTVRGNASSTLASDFTAFNVDRGNSLFGGKVGIGTSTPASELHVNGDIEMGVGNTTRALYAYNDGRTYHGKLELYNLATGNTTLQTTFDSGDILLLPGTSGGNVGIGTTTPSAKLSIESLGFDGAGTVGLDQYLVTENSSDGATQLGNKFFLNASNTATTTLVGGLYRIKDDTEFGNTVRGLEVQTNRGVNTAGENTALSGFARTFGVRGVTTGDAGSSFEPAGGYFETEGTFQGNAIRGYSDSITTATLLSLFQDTSDFQGTGLEMNFGNTTGDFSSTSSKYLDFQNAGTSVFTVSAYGTTTIGDGVNQAGLQIGLGGICVDNDGDCTASTTGRITAVESHLGNSDLAEMYFSSTELEPGEVVTLAGGLSVDRATPDSTDPVIGVVSTKPGLTIGADDTSLNEDEKGYPIALSGRVPVRLSNENGPIKKGDELMLSSLPGVAMKASGTGMVVGIAMEDFDESKKYSETFVNQFGDDLVDPIYEPVKTNTDPRINDGCYYSGGSATGDEVCTPLNATSSVGQIEETNNLMEQESVAEQLAELASEASEEYELDNGEQVKVGSVVMFVNLSKRWLDDSQLASLGALTSTSSLDELGENENETMFDRLLALANSFIDGVLSIFELKADRIEVADEICLDGVCIDSDQLRNLLEADQGGTAPTSGDESSTPTGDDEGGDGTDGDQSGTDTGSETPTDDGGGEVSDTNGSSTLDTNDDEVVDDGSSSTTTDEGNDDSETSTSNDESTDESKSDSTATGDDSNDTETQDAGSDNETNEGDEEEMSDETEGESGDETNDVAEDGSTNDSSDSDPVSDNDEAESDDGTNN